MISEWVSYQSGIAVQLVYSSLSLYLVRGYTADVCKKNTSQYRQFKAAAPALFMVTEFKCFGLEFSDLQMKCLQFEQREEKIRAG